MLDLDVTQLSRLQFGLTALYHFLFVPLTIGLALLLAIMESVYVMTNREIWRQMTKFWGILFGINFAMGVATGITMEFQFGTNWAYYSHYVGDIFGAPLAIEGLMAFFLEATFVGLFFFGWDRLSKRGHLLVTWLVAAGSNLSAFWILVANAWMQYPVGSRFNYQTMRMEMTSFYDIIFSPVAQSKFVHTVSACYVTGAVFVMSISAYYLLRGRYQELAKRSLTVAASFGLASALSVVVLGDESGYTTSQNQKMKLAAIEAMWETEPAPAGFIIFGVPNLKTHQNDYELKVPWVLGLIATRTLDTPLPGIKDLVKDAQKRIKRGIIAYDALNKLRQSNEKPDPQTLALFEEHQHDLGYGLLLKRYTPTVIDATENQINKAAWDTVPNITPLFWSFRLMVGIGFTLVALFATAFYLSTRRKLEQSRWFLRFALWGLPLPWIAAELGWIVAEHGRQPWAIEGMLPTFLGVSSVGTTQVWISLLGFVVFYTFLAIIDVFLMIKYIKQGPIILEEKP
ncbi:MAG: cytochrome bd-I ubiquinol oxidase subunit CydA [Alphaproteobacteria bacterium]|nr:cytochrome bd-I ubiquinol oxidase subunit CydA [Alphaproteobacteria bacterium]